MLSQALLLLYFKMDNGSNVCGIEFNYDNEEKEEQEEQEEDDTNSLVGVNLAESEMYYNDQILRQLFLGFQVVSEKGK